MDRDIHNRQYVAASASGRARQHNGDVVNGNTYIISMSHTLTDNTDADEARAASFRKAAAEGHTQRVQRLVRFGADLDCYDDRGLTALHHATLSGFEDTVDLLLREGADINSESDYGTPLCLAALKSRGEICRLLLAYRASALSGRGALGSAVHAACFARDATILTILLESESGRLAVQEPKTINMALLEDLRIRGWSTRQDETQHQRFLSPFDFTVLHKMVELTKLLLTHGEGLFEPDVNQGGSDQPPPLQVAVTNMDVDMVKLLLEGPSVKYAKQNLSIPFEMAAQDCSISMIRIMQLLLKRGASIVTLPLHRGFNALDNAAERDHIERVEAIVQAQTASLNKGSDNVQRTGCDWLVALSVARRARCTQATRFLEATLAYQFLRMGNSLLRGDLDSFFGNSGRELDYERAKAAMSIKFPEMRDGA